jgi:hypothetical protein
VLRRSLTERSFHFFAAKQSIPRGAGRATTTRAQNSTTGGPGQWLSQVRSLLRLSENDPADQACRGSHRKKRVLTLESIERTLAAPDFTKPDPNDPTLTRSFKAINEAGGRILRVVHRPEENDIVIATAHFDRDAKP